MPLMVKPPNAGGLTSRITSLPLGISTLSPAAGTLFSGQVAGSDQRVSWARAMWKPPSMKQTGRALVNKKVSKRVSMDTREYIVMISLPEVE
ncbi:MAG: hypothetical protein P8M72_00790 [Gammaproteobacteria bacterium]|nr:hypothetical protein [Gammaproteobacteria bacterium]